MNNRPSLFLHETRSVWLDHRLLLAVLAAAPVIGAADYLALAHALSYDSNFGFVAILTRGLPLLSAVAAYLLFKDIGGDATGSPYQVLPVPGRIASGVRFALLALFGVLWPALIAAVVASMSFPDTCADQAVQFAVWNALAVAFGAFLGVRVPRPLHAATYLGFGLGALCFSTVQFEVWAKSQTLVPWMALIPPAILAVFLWRTLASGRAPATRRVWCAELLLVVVAMAAAPWSYTASLTRLFAADAPGPKETVLPEVRGDLKLYTKGGHGSGTYNGMRFANRSAGFPGLPLLPLRYASTEGEWRLIDASGAVTPWRPLQSRERIPDAPAVQISYPKSGLFEAMIKGDAESIRVAREAQFRPGSGGGIGLELPNGFGPKATLPYSTLKSYLGKTLELRGKSVVRLGDYREVLRTKELSTKLRWAEPSRAFVVKLSENAPKATHQQPSVAVESEVTTLNPWLIEPKEEWRAHTFGALAGGKLCMDTGFCGSGRPNKLAYGQKGSGGFQVGYFADTETPAVRPDTVVLLEVGTGDTVIVPFHVTVKIPTDF